MADFKHYYGAKSKHLREGSIRKVRELALFATAVGLISWALIPSEQSSASVAPDWNAAPFDQNVRANTKKEPLLQRERDNNNSNYKHELKDYYASQTQTENDKSDKN